MLVPQDGALKCLALAAIGEMEGLTPAPLVEFSGKVVVLVHKLGVRVVTGINRVFVELVVIVNALLEALATAHGGEPLEGGSHSEEEWLKSGRSRSASPTPWGGPPPRAWSTTGSTRTPTRPS